MNYLSNGRRKTTQLRIVRYPRKCYITLRMTNVQRRRAASGLTAAAVTGFVPLLCYLTSSMSSFGIGVQVQNLATGLWVTMAGFGLAFVAGLVISTAAALSDQMPKPPTPNKPA